MLKKRQNEVKRNIFLFDEVKKHSRTSPDVQFKEFSLTKQRKTRPRMDYEWIEKIIFKKNQIKNKKNRKSMSKCRMWKKATSAKWKFNSNKKLGLEWAVNGLGKLFRKIFDPKNRKTVKIKVKLPHVNKKTTTEKPNFCSNTVFSLYFKIRAQKIHAAKPLAFSLHFLFRRDQIYHSNLTSKIMKMCEQILKKKRQRPNTIQILWIVKK